jgi:hypothetical protein
VGTSFSTARRMPSVQRMPSAVPAPSTAFAAYSIWRRMSAEGARATRARCRSHAPGRCGRRASTSRRTGRSRCPGRPWRATCATGESGRCVKRREHWVVAASEAGACDAVRSG